MAKDSDDSDFLKIVVKDVTLQWPRLDQPYRFDHIKQETVPCAASAQHAGYSVSWVCSLEEGREFFKTVQAHYNACRARKPSLPPFTRVFGMKKDEASGKVTFTAKKRASNDDGTPRTPPRLVDVHNKELEDPRIWSGSEGGVRIYAFPSIDPQTKEGGISLLLNAVVIAKAVYGSDNLAEDFGDMMKSPVSGAFDAMDRAPASAPQPAKAAALDGDVPF